MYWGLTASSTRVMFHEKKVSEEICMLLKKYVTVPSLLYVSHVKVYLHNLLKEWGQFTKLKKKNLNGYRGLPTWTCSKAVQMHSGQQNIHTANEGWLEPKELYNLKKKERKEGIATVAESRQTRAMIKASWSWDHKYPTNNNYCWGIIWARHKTAKY